MPTESGSLRIELFNPTRHDRSGFDCGVTRLNNFLKFSAKTRQKADMTRVYVAVEQGQVKIHGYHAINLGMMNVDALTKRPRGTADHGELPVLFLGQVALHQGAQGQGIGSILMHHVFEKARRVSEQAGCYAILLDVMSDGDKAAFDRRRDWYREFGFQSFVGRPARMFMTMKQVRAILNR